MDILKRIDNILNEWSDDVENPGLLAVPSGKSVMDMPLAHFVKLAKKKGTGSIVKGLMNLYRWNKNSNPKLSSWAKNMQEQLSAKMSD